MASDVIDTDFLADTSLVDIESTGASARFCEMQYISSDSNIEPCALPPLLAFEDIAEFLDSIESMSKKDLLSATVQHQLQIPSHFISKTAI